MGGIFNAAAKLDPLSKFNAKIDPGGNAIGMYGKDAPKSIDPAMDALNDHFTPSAADTTARDKVAAAQQTQPTTSAQLVQPDPTLTKRSTSGVLFGQ